MERETCRRCFRPIAQQADWDAHPPGCSCAHCAGLCWGSNCVDRRDARIAELEAECERLRGDLATPFDAECAELRSENERLLVRVHGALAACRVGLVELAIVELDAALAAGEE